MTTRHLRLVRNTDIVIPAHTTPVHRNDAWLAAPLNEKRGTIKDLLPHIPLFERRPFRVTTGLIALSADHPRWDVIVRVPNDETYSDVPVGVVSKTYKLVQHRDVLHAVADALEANHIDPAALSCELRLSEYAERMELSVRLPAAHDFNPGDGFPIGLTLHAANSVDGTTRLSLLLGWFRYVCSNGLVVGTTAGRARYVHNGNLHLVLFGKELSNALQRATRERSVLQRWATRSVAIDSVRTWADGVLTKKWGVKAATRAYHIFLNGRDVRLTQPFEHAAASQRRVEFLRAVPGSGGTTLYAVSQALAWLARERSDYEERMKWLYEIPVLVRALALATASQPAQA